VSKEGEGLGRKQRRRTGSENRFLARLNERREQVTVLDPKARPKVEELLPPERREDFRSKFVLPAVEESQFSRRNETRSADDVRRKGGGTASRGGVTSAMTCCGSKGGKDGKEGNEKKKVSSRFDTITRDADNSEEGQVRTVEELNLLQGGTGGSERDRRRGGVNHQKGEDEAVGFGGEVGGSEGNQHCSR
jgi:hypothetical protein